eukprot:CAMPEP_0175157310 /NCGR_PEP_ID=MMETSP0087-20121206/22130_1 /TAXON_ID=136419 /ORGANISM="Unknown Unknown, Strain D1" /LENGTH=154 /DNA_ID=CAMNT_0016444903 /DNA_START=97 /DNA_END=561 /DNA_ORIENTATION=-
MSLPVLSVRDSNSKRKKEKKLTAPKRASSTANTLLPAKSPASVVKQGLLLQKVRSSPVFETLNPFQLSQGFGGVPIVDGTVTYKFLPQQRELVATLQQPLRPTVLEDNVGARQILNSLSSPPIPFARWEKSLKKSQAKNNAVRSPTFEGSLPVL